MTPVLVMARLPLSVKVTLLDVVATVPEIVPEAVEASVRFNLAADAPRVKVAPEATVKLLVTVKVLPEVAAAKVQVLFMVRLLKLTLGTAVILPL